GLAFLGDQLYLLTASGGWEIGDPDFHNGLFHVSPDGSVERIFDYSAYTLEHPTRSRLEDPRADVPLGMPYGLAALNGHLYSMVGTRTPRDGQIARLHLAPGPGARTPSPASTPAPWLIGLGLGAAVVALVLGLRRRSRHRGEAERGPQHAARA